MNSNSSNSSSIPPLPCHRRASLVSSPYVPSFSSLEEKWKRGQRDRTAQTFIVPDLRQSVRPRPVVRVFQFRSLPLPPISWEIALPSNPANFPFLPRIRPWQVNVCSRSRLSPVKAIRFGRLWTTSLPSSSYFFILFLPRLLFTSFEKVPLTPASILLDFPETLSHSPPSSSSVRPFRREARREYREILASSRRPGGRDSFVGRVGDSLEL